MKVSHIAPFYFTERSLFVFVMGVIVFILMWSDMISTVDTYVWMDEDTCKFIISKQVAFASKRLMLSRCRRMMYDR